ncbi:MAG: hypothetical protein IPK82_22655 [Polyangiaceae bacterium]|nr:hypothetical protein [Polyangiaceae bacterium]
MKQISRLAFASAALCTHALLSLPGCDGGSDGTGGAGGNAAGSVQVQISGEDIATAGFLFPDGSEVRIADGWEIQFSHVLVSLQSVSLNENPDKAPSDQSQMGNLIAEEVGPWVIDLAKEGDVPGAGGEGTAFNLVTIAKQNKNGDAPSFGGRAVRRQF